MADQTLQYIFTPGIPQAVVLPINGNSANFIASTIIGLSGAVSLSACFDKYGILWKWSTFETGISSLQGTNSSSLCALSSLAVINVSALSTSFVAFPSSWATLQCELSAGSTNVGIPTYFTKRWVNEGALSATYFNKSSICTVGTYVWTLCSETGWSYTSAIPTSASEQFTYTLRIDEDGILPGTVSERADTDLLLNVKLTGTCFLSANELEVPAYYYPVVDHNYTFQSVTPPAIRLYTPNRFVLSGTIINFQNLLTYPERVNRIELDFDDGKLYTLSGPELLKTFLTETYNTPGYKTIKATIHSNIPSTSASPYTVTYPNMIQVLSIYDQVSPSEYRTELEPLNLPWTDQPRVGSNDWVVEDNINSCFKKFNDNLNYLESRGRYYEGTYSDYFGWLGPQPLKEGRQPDCEIWTWRDLDCFTSELPYTVTWRDILSGETFVNSGKYVNCGAWYQQECGRQNTNPTCEGKYTFGDICTRWNWRDRNSKTIQLGTPQITWVQTASGGEYKKRWLYEPCELTLQTFCDEGIWNVNLTNFDFFYDPIQATRVTSKCNYTGVASKNNHLFLCQNTQIKLLSSDFEATFYNSVNQIDDIQSFSNIKNISIDSTGKFFVLDGVLSQVVSFLYNSSQPRNRLEVYVTWGGFGTASSPTRFSNPNDLHIDMFDNIWVTDTGNNCVKLFSNSGSWIRTIIDDDLRDVPPLSLCVDSQQNIHILTNKEIRVYNYTGIFLYSYKYDNHLNATPTRINSSYNREIIYVATKTQVIKFFRNGVFAGNIITNQPGVTNITGLYHDEFRNLLITTDNLVLKYPDIMTLKRIKGGLPSTYWSLDDIYIHKEEYIQNWVYTKAFQRMWDNIELFRNTLQYTDEGCTAYRPPIHAKNKMIVGQNEIVTASTINRVLGYLWDNFSTLLNHFDPICVNKSFAGTE